MSDDHNCIYGFCRARNLCKNRCVGKGLLENDNYIIDKGQMRTATDEERELLLPRLKINKETAA